MLSKFLEETMVHSAFFEEPLDTVPSKQTLFSLLRGCLGYLFFFFFNHCDSTADRNLLKGERAYYGSQFREDSVSHS